MKLKFISALIFSFFISSAAVYSAAPQSSSPQRSLQEWLGQEISNQYHQAKIEFTGPIQWIKGPPSTEMRSLSIVEDDKKGNIHFIIQGVKALDTSSLLPSSVPVAEGWVGFNAWIQARAAQRRIKPYEKLSAELFTVRPTNIAQGEAREFRGLILSQDVDVARLESIQTLLEGQLLVSSAVRKLPDIRKGDSIRILLRTGDLVLSTQGIAEEPGYEDRQIRVMTAKTKRELVGQLRANGIVEVSL